MGNLRACFAVAVLAMAVACGEDHAKADAAIVIVDAPPDAKEFFDAPPPMYDLTCYGGAAPTTAADPITIAGTTQTLGQGGSSPVGGVAVTVYKTTSTAPVAATVSDMTTGDFMTGNIATMGTPLNGYIRALDNAATPEHRTTYLYPPSLVVASLTDVPVIMVSISNFTTLQTVASVQQDDTNNGALVFTVVDCSLTDPQPIEGATVTVKQNNQDVGTLFDIGALLPQAAGTYFVFNVPDGETQIAVTYNNMAFPTRTVTAYKKPMGPTAVGTITATAVRPGP